jgi:dihydroorotate dehydrogenase (NAD+) catalytic subunit
MKPTSTDKAPLRGPRLGVEIAGVRFKNPVLTASGTFGYGLEFAPYLDLNAIGGIVVKGLSMKPIAGFELDEYLEVARFLNDCPGVHALELNISCPNVGKGGFHFNKDPRDTHKITAEVRRASPRLPLWVKLSPNVTDIREFARAAEEAGADALSVINTLVGMAIDVHSRRPRLRFRTGGLSGPAIKPVALRMVWEACQAVRIPVIGIGGIATAEDALEFLIAGARAVQVGTANFYEPAVSERIALGLGEYCRAHRIDDIHEIIGSLRDYE